MWKWNVKIWFPVNELGQCRLRIFRGHEPKIFWGLYELLLLVLKINENRTEVDSIIFHASISYLYKYLLPTINYFLNFRIDFHPKPFHQNYFCTENIWAKFAQLSIYDLSMNAYKPFLAYNLYRNSIEPRMSTCVFSEIGLWVQRLFEGLTAKI